MDFTWGQNSPLAFYKIFCYNYYRNKKEGLEEVGMARTREIQCIHYIAEKQCGLGKEGTFRKQCQTCKSYKKLPGGRPARTDNRRQKMDRIMRKEKYNFD